jgi:hypothetical protein
MQNRSCFGLFQFEPKFIFVCFEDTLLTMVQVSNIALVETKGITVQLGTNILII